MDWMIRQARPAEKQNVNDAHVRSIRTIVAADYNQMQIDAWSAVKYSDEIWNHSLTEDHYRVVEIENHIEGFCHSRIRDDGKGVILGLYLTEKALGKGIGRALMEDAKTFFRTNYVSEVVVVATKTAFGFYQCMGFDMTGQQIDHSIRGVDIEVYPMRMKL